jgi:dihydropyrimidine dehydrogenase (NAD+) subunit PreA
MKYGFRIIEDLCDGLSNYLDQKGLRGVSELRGRALPAVTNWEELDLNYKIVADVDQDKCIGCGLCYAACNDGAHQSIAAHAEHGKTRVEILTDSCVGCNLCSLVCPVDGCITMKRVDTHRPMLTWKEYSKDPASHTHLLAHLKH